MNITKVSIENFKGIKHFAANLQHTTIIKADNGAGKTSVYDAVCWLLFEKDSQNQTKFEIVHRGCEVASVEAVMMLDDGKEVALKKIYNLLKRASEFYINEVPIKKKEFDERILTLGNEKILRSSLNPLYFNEMLSWQERREILLDLFVQSDFPIPTELKEYLEKYSIDDFKKLLTSKIKQIKKQAEQIPARIEELSGIGGVNNINEEGISKEILALKTSLSSDNIEKEILALKATIQAEHEKQRQLKQEKITKIFEARSKLILRDISREEALLVELRDAWKKEQTNCCTIIGTCPTCGQEIPQEKIDETFRRFNREKAIKLEKISNDGKTISEKIDGFNAENFRLVQERRRLEEQLQRIENEEIVTPAELSSKLFRLERRLDEIDEVVTKQKICELEEKLAASRSAKGVRMRINELKKEEKVFLTELSENEQKLFSLQNFIQQKIESVEKNINDKFKFVKFKLFEKQVNGEIKETCEVTVGDISWSNLNHAAKINAGLDIISQLPVRAPIFIDNAESINEILQTDNQQIRLYVSQDKKIKVEA